MKIQLIANTAAAFALIATPAMADVPKPAALIADGIPPVADDLPVQTRPYLESRAAGIEGWDARDRSMIIGTRFANTVQLHRVAGPGMARTQITFEGEPVSGYLSSDGAVTVVQKDTGGDEFYQLYRLDNGRLSLLTDGTSRNQFGAFSADGRLVGYSSTRRNIVDSDLYVVDPRDPGSDRMVAQVNGGGWNLLGFSPDGARAIVSQYVSIQKSNLWLLDVARGGLAPLGDHRKAISHGSAAFAPDGTLWATSDEGSDFRQLGTIDPRSGKFSPRAPEPKWDVDFFAIAQDGSFIAYVVNVAGASRLKLLDPRSGVVRTVESLPAGVIADIKVAPWGAIGVTLSAAKVPTDAFSVDPATLAATRWTFSETGGLDPAINVEPEFIEVKSFDGEPVSGFLYRPDPTRFPGKRPLLFNIHGGPEGQSRASFRGRTNYLINELGIAVFYPNVRGSTGFGKRFVSLDNGPFKREDSVRDIGAFLDRLQADPAIDPARMAQTGGSYGGYMCYAGAIRYAGRFKAADCVVAISNFVTFLENTQGYRRDLRRAEYGDERVATQRRKLLEISPLTSVSSLKMPLLVVTGANDPRVPKSEADQIVKAVRDNGGAAWHLVGTNEGHGFARKENADYQFWTELMFWRTHLLGQ